MPVVNEQANIFSTDEAGALVRALRGSQQPVSWHQRTWRMSEVTTADELGPETFLFGRPRPPYIVLGKLGFERRGYTTAVWEGEKFSQQEIPYGSVSPFAINTNDFTIIFQTRGQDIRVNSFVGAFHALMRLSPYGPYRLESDSRQIGLTQWLSTVSRVTRMHFRVELPNPNWRGRPRTEEIFESMRLQSYTADFRGEDIETNAEYARELINHTTERGYGDATAEAEREPSSPSGTPQTVTYQSTLGGEATLSERYMEVEGGVASYRSLADELLSYAAEP